MLKLFREVELLNTMWKPENTMTWEGLMCIMLEIHYKKIKQLKKIIARFPIYLGSLKMCCNTFNLF